MRRAHKAITDGAMAAATSFRAGISLAIEVSHGFDFPPRRAQRGEQTNAGKQQQEHIPSFHVARKAIVSSALSQLRIQHGPDRDRAVVAGVHAGKR